jgi:hypothetical protein
MTHQFASNKTATTGVMKGSVPKTAVLNVGIWNSVGDFTDEGEISALKGKFPGYCLASRGVNTKTV